MSIFIVSACLTGQNCKYNGGNNECQWVLDFVKNHTCVLVCPEAGRLPTPRPPSEIIGGRAIDKDGKDITAQLKKGAALSWEKAEQKAKSLDDSIDGAILKANSPSCGCGEIYDGTFQGRLVRGDGFFAALLKEKGIKITTEKEVIK